MPHAKRGEIPLYADAFLKRIGRRGKGLDQRANISVHFTRLRLGHFIGALVVVDNEKVFFDFILKCSADAENVSAEIMRRSACTNNAIGLVAFVKKQRIYHCNEVGRGVCIGICMNVMLEMDFLTLQRKKRKKSRKERVKA